MGIPFPGSGCGSGVPAAAAAHGVGPFHCHSAGDTGRVTASGVTAARGGGCGCPATATGGGFCPCRTLPGFPFKTPIGPAHYTGIPAAAGCPPYRSTLVSCRGPAHCTPHTGTAPAATGSGCSRTPFGRFGSAIWISQPQNLNTGCHSLLPSYFEFKGWGFGGFNPVSLSPLRLVIQGLTPQTTGPCTEHSPRNKQKLKITI
jgi:hypothetical protein